MDERVPNSLPGLKNVSHCGTIVEFVRDGRRIVSVPGSNSTCGKLGIDKRGRKNITVGILYQQSVERSEGTISTDGKTSFRPHHGFQKVKTLLPSTCDQCYDGPPA